MQNLCKLIEKYSGRILVVTDTNVAKKVFPHLSSACPVLSELPRFEIVAGEENKTPETVALIWQKLLDSGAPRSHLILNVGGGMVSDIGGFAAATYKRGIDYANVATTVLAASDAAIGGKTGVNLGGVKNAVGAFKMPLETFICSRAFETLPRDELLSGYGEILKTALVGNPKLLAELYEVEENIGSANRLAALAKEASKFKIGIVTEDPQEAGKRKILNFGHTFGHALESLMTRRHTPVAHGIAVAHGIIVALILSKMKLNVDVDPQLLYRLSSEIVKPYMRVPEINCEDYQAIFKLMSVDKKNSSTDYFRFVLLEQAGKPIIDVPVTSEELKPALDIYRDLLYC